MSERTLRIDGVDYAVESAVRFDRAQFVSKPWVDKQTGFLHVDASLTRAPAVFNYQNGDGTVRREFRDAADVFSQENLARMATGVITMDHPPESVNAENIKSYQVGYGKGNIRIVEDHAYVGLVVADKEAIQDVLTGKVREVSLGYDCDLVAMPGVHKDSTGVEYGFDVKQVNHRNNHIALVQRGRAGTARIHMDSAHAIQVLDSDKNPPPPPPPRVKTMENTDIEQLKQRLDSMQKELESEKKRNDTLQAAKDVLAQAQEQKSRADTDELVKKMARERSALLKSAQAVGRFDSAAMVKLETLDNLDIKRQALAATGLSVADKSEHYIDAAFDYRLNDAQATTRSVQNVDRLGAEIATAAATPSVDDEDAKMAALSMRCDAAIRKVDESYTKPVAGGWTSNGPTVNHNFA